jgi:hypothetical protein
LEAVGRGKLSTQSRHAVSNAFQSHYLEECYELTFHVVRPNSTIGKLEDKTSTSSPLQSFTARLLFPSSTISHFAKTALPHASSSTKSHDKVTYFLPEEIRQQFRKLLYGAGLTIPKELKSITAKARGYDELRPHGLISAAAAKMMVLADLMTQDLHHEGSTTLDSRAAVAHMLRSGRILTKGLVPAEEVLAIQVLEKVLHSILEEVQLEEILTSVQIVLDRESNKLCWEILSSKLSGKCEYIFVCPADSRRVRHSLAFILHLISHRNATEA